MVDMRVAEVNVALAHYGKTEISMVQGPD